MFQKVIILFVFISWMASCIQKDTDHVSVLPVEGEWRGIIHTLGQELPFNFKLEYQPEQQPVITLINGEENIRIEEATFKGDSIYIPMHIFDAAIVAYFEGNSMKGYWIKNYAKGYKIPFSAIQGETHRFFESPDPATVDVTGKWEVYFENKSGKKLAVGLFQQAGNQVSGTFLKATGDYRFLAGEINGNTLSLSTFDGEHAYLFHAIIDGDQMKGDFFSGKTRHDTWTATRNEEISLPDPLTMTFLKEGYETIAFTLPDMNGNLDSLSNPKYSKKVVIIQIFGTWCPNCMDETKFLSDWYRKNKDRGVEIIALAFERKDDFDYAKSRIEKLKKRFDIQYSFLFGGKSDKEFTSKALPMLNNFVSFPTTIFIDRDGRVRQIHAGFTGPGTGTYYEDFVTDFNLFMDELIAE